MTKPNGVTAIAGYVGTDAQWMEAETRWDQALAYWELDDFHLCDLPGIMGHTKAGLCALNFARIVVDTKLTGVSAGLEDAYWDSKPFYSEDYGSRYHTCAHMLFNTLNDEVRLSVALPREPVAVVMDDDVQPHTAVEALFDRYKSAGNLAELNFSNRRRTKRLQAADLAAGTLRKDWFENDYFRMSPANYTKLRAYVRGVHHRSTYLSFESERIANEAQRRRRQATG